MVRAPSWLEVIVSRSVLAAVCGLLVVAQTANAQAIRIVPVPANHLVYSPLTGRLYASVYAADSITEIDPVTGGIGASFPVGRHPDQLAISDTGEYLYVALEGLPGVVRVHLPTRTVGTPFTLGAPDPVAGARMVSDMAVLPGNPDAVAVARHFADNFFHHAGVAVYDLGVPRPTTTSDAPGSNYISFGATAARLYGFTNQDALGTFNRLDVAPTGVTVVDETPNLSGFQIDDMKYFGGRVITSRARIIDGEARTTIATLPGVGFPYALEPTANGLYFVGVGLGNTWDLRAFDPVTLARTLDGRIPGAPDNPSDMVAAGPGTLAIASGGHDVYLVDPALLQAAPPILTIESPTRSNATAVDSSSITLAGTAADANGSVVGVSWSTNRGFAGAATGTTSWTAGDIPLALGSNVITVTATDNSGQTAVDTLEVMVGAFTSFLAEGATGSFFDYDLALANPSLTSVDAALTFFTQAGATVSQTVTLPARSRRTVRVDEVPGLENTTMSTTVRTTTTPIVVERTMRWGTPPGPQYGAHGDRATAGAASTWYFAEGSQGFFFTYLLLANTSASANTASILWLIEGQSALPQTVTLPPNSRTTIDAGAVPLLRGKSFGIVVNFAQPAVAERAMYFGTPPDQLFKGGHDSAGVTTPSTQWILAEGATGPFFETFVLLANPGNSPVDVNLRFITQTGVEVSRTVTVNGFARRTVNLEALSPAAPELANAAVSTIVTASGPIVAERAQYWPGGGADWYEAHNSFGVTAARTRWGLAEGRVGNPAGVPAADYQTYVLLANPGPTAAGVTITFLRETGAPVVRTFTVPPGSRFNVAVAGPLSTVPELADEMFGAVIDSTQPIVVERAMYGSAGPQVFGLGTNATGTPLP